MTFAASAYSSSVFPNELGNRVQITVERLADVYTLEVQV